MENVQFNVNRCDLTNETSKMLFLQETIGDAYNLMIKHGIKVTVAMLYDEDETLDHIKSDFNGREITRFGRTELRHFRSYIVDNLPDGEWNVIMPNKLNWPEDGEGGPAYYHVGTLKWDFKKQTAIFTGFIISEEEGSEFLKDTDVLNEDFSLYADNIIIAWKSPEKDGGTGMDWLTPDINKYVIAKFTAKVEQGCLND